jgi:hypothetical protein
MRSARFSYEGELNLPTKNQNKRIKTRLKEKNGSDLVIPYGFLRAHPIMRRTHAWFGVAA